MLTTIREEQLLAKFAGEDVAVPQPCTRTEKFLAKMAGLDVQTPTPITREEQILNKIAEGGGGGGGGEEVTVSIVNNDTEQDRPTVVSSLETNGLVNGLRIYNGEYYYDEFAISRIPGETTQERKYLKLSEYFYIQVPSLATASGNAEIVFLESLEVHAAKISGDCVITIERRQ